MSSILNSAVVLWKDYMGLREGHPLTFRVENQIGYVADSIYVNGATFEADYVTDNDDGPHTAWYSVPEIYEGAGSRGAI